MPNGATPGTRERDPARERESGPSSALASLSAEVSQVKDVFRAAYAAFERASRFTVLARYGQAQAMIDAHGVEVFMEQVRRAQQPKRLMSRIMRLFRTCDTLTHNLLVDFCLDTLSPEDITALEQQLRRTGNSFTYLEEHATQTMADALSETQRQASAIAEKIQAEMENVRLQIAALAHSQHLPQTEIARRIEERLSPFRTLLGSLQSMMLLPSEHEKPLQRTQRNNRRHPAQKNGQGAQRPGNPLPTPKGA